jgi:hypothetical protein
MTRNEFLKAGLATNVYLASRKVLSAGSLNPPLSRNKYRKNCR